MKRIIVAMVIAVLGSLVRPADATNLPSCCACVETHHAQTSGPAGADSQVYFCAEAVSGDIPELESRCETISSLLGVLTCESNIPGPSCRSQLAESGIICPAAGAPAASPLNLMALAAVLAVLGTAGVHRRRRLRSSVEDRP